MISFEQTVPWFKKNIFLQTNDFQKPSVLEKLLHLQVRENYYGDLNCDPPKFTGASQVLVVKKPPTRARDIRDTGSIPGARRSPRGGLGNPLQYSCLQNPTDRGGLVGYSPWGCNEFDMTVAT